MVTKYEMFVIEFPFDYIKKISSYSCFGCENYFSEMVLAVVYGGSGRLCMGSGHSIQ